MNIVLKEAQDIIITIKEISQLLIFMQCYQWQLWILWIGQNVRFSFKVTNL